LLQIICPQIYYEWSQVIKTHSFHPIQQQSVDKYIKETSGNEPAPVVVMPPPNPEAQSQAVVSNDTEMANQEGCQDLLQESSNAPAGKENQPPVFS
jgi:hypothetical protein